MKTLPKQRGSTLVELLIGLTIGVFLLLGLANVFGQSRQTYNYQLSQAGQQGNERLSAVIMTTALEQAGFAPMNAINIVNPAASFPGDGVFGAGEGISGTQADHNVTVNGVAGTVSYPADTLSVRYWGGDAIVDCVGTAVADTVLATNVFATNGINLTCDRNGGGAQSIMGDGTAILAQQLRVLGMRVSYGLDTNGDDSVDQFQRADNVASWNDVRIAEIELFIQSGQRPPESLSFTVTLENLRGAA
jgi:type IV pilus assembly protein PilW